MPYQITWEENGCYVRFQGRVSDEELVQLRQACYADRRFEDIRYVLNDMRECESVDDTFSKLKRRAAGDMFAKILNDQLKVAIVTNDQRIKALADQYRQVEIDVYESRVFVEMAEARRWIESPG